LKLVRKVIPKKERHLEARAQADILRDVFGNPFRSVPFDPGWQAPTAVGLALAVYQEPDSERMAVLADALEEAGCTEKAILDHLRGPRSHVRGCWLVDLVLAKE
jgi:hypothetical protein